MAVVKLRNPLRQLAGGTAEHRLDGACVLDVLRALEAEQPGLAGWILDERGRVRRHINVFVNGEGVDGDTPVVDGDRVDVIPAISGG